MPRGIELEIRETFRRIVLGRVATQSPVGKCLLAARPVVPVERFAERRYRFTGTVDDVRTLMACANQWSPDDLDAIRQALKPSVRQGHPLAARPQERARATANSIAQAIILLAGE